MFELGAGLGALVVCATLRQAVEKMRQVHAIGGAATCIQCDVEDAQGLPPKWWSWKWKL